MTLIKPINDDARGDCVAVAEELYEEAIIAVADIKKQIERQDLDALPDMRAVVKNATEATKMLLGEVSRVHELRKKQSGIVHDYAIDFDAARDEIRRRLACLRGAGDG